MSRHILSILFTFLLFISLSLTYTLQAQQIDSTVISITNVSCNGSCDGTATVDSVDGVAPPFSYLWSNGDTTATVDSLCPGSYTVTITDSNNFSRIDTITITEPTLLSASIISSTNGLCGGVCDGGATAIAAGGTQPYDYTWNSGETDSVASVLCAGTNWVTVTDANGCQVVDSVIITEPPPIFINSTVSLFNGPNISCNGGNDGFISLSVSGGIPPYNYLWSPTGDTTQNLVNLGADTYSVEVTDANGCIKTLQIILNEPGILIANILSSSTPLCAGTCSGNATVISSGGTSPFFYNWSNGESTQTAVSLCAGNHAVIVTDVNGCSDTTAFLMDETPAFELVNQEVRDITVCREDSFVITFSNIACDTISDVKVFLELPEGVRYIIGSVSSNIVAIADFDTTDLTAPVFNIPFVPDSGILNTISIKFKFQAGCTVISSDSVDNVVQVAFDFADTLKATSLKYAIQYPVLAISQVNISPNPYEGNVKDTACRTITVINTGDAPLFTGFTLLESYGPSIEIISVDTGMADINTSNNTVSIFVPDSLLPQGGLQPDESFTITECFTILKCTHILNSVQDGGRSQFSYYWQCGQDTCQMSGVTANILVPNENTASIRSTATYLNKDFCLGPGNVSTIEVLVENLSDGPAFDLEFEIFGNAYMALDTGSIDFFSAQGDSVIGINLQAETVEFLDTGFICRDSVIKSIRFNSLPDLPGNSFHKFRLNVVTCCPDTATDTSIVCGQQLHKRLGAVARYKQQCDTDSVWSSGNWLIIERSSMEMNYSGGLTDLDDNSDTLPFDGDVGFFSFDISEARFWSGANPQVFKAVFSLDGGLCFDRFADTALAGVYYDISRDSTFYWWADSITVDIDTNSCCPGAVIGWFTRFGWDSLFQIVGSEFRIRLVACCNAPPTSTIDLDLFHLPFVSGSCPDTCEIPMACAEGVAFIHCPGCVRHGSDRLNFSASRINYGEPDNQGGGGNGVEDTTGTLSVGPDERMTVMVGDTLQTVLSSKVLQLDYPDPPPNGFEFGYYELGLPARCFNSLTPLGATVRIYDWDDNDTLPGTTDTSFTFFYPAADVDTFGGFTFRYDFSVDAMQQNIQTQFPSYFDRFHWKDSVIFMPQFKVTGNILDDKRLCSPVVNHIYMGFGSLGPTCCDAVNSCVPDTIFDEFGNPVLDSSGSVIIGVQLTDGRIVPQCDSTVQYFCENHGGEFFLMGYRYSTYSIVRPQNCEHVVGLSNSLRVGTVFDVTKPSNNFPYEYRAWGFTDTVKIRVPLEFGVDSIHLRQSRTVNSGGYFTQQLQNFSPYSTFADSTDTVININTGQYYTFNTFWANQTPTDSLYYSDDDAGFEASTYFHPTCLTPTDDYLFPGYISYQPLFAPDQGPNFDAQWEPVLKYVKPAFDRQQDLTEVDGVTKKACWSFRLRTFQGTAFNTWLFPDSLSTAGIHITEITVDGGSPLVPDTNGFLQLGIVDGSPKKIQICGNYECIGTLPDDSIKIYFGWDCPGYPVSISNYRCTPDSFYLKLTPREANLQDSVVVEDTIDMCDSILVEVFVSSTEVGNILGIHVQAVIPEGTSLIPGSDVLIYPRDAGSPQLADVNDALLQNGDTLTWNLDSVSAFLRDIGLPGTGYFRKYTASSADSTNLVLSFYLESHCDLAERDTIFVSTFGVTNCNDTIDPEVNEQLIVVQGYPSPASKSIRMEVDNFSTCDSTATVHVNILNADADDSTDANDRFYVLLPQCVQFDSTGMFISITNGPPTTTPAIAGDTLFWTLPGDVAPGDSMVFSFEVVITDTACGITAFLFEGITTSRDSLGCGLDSLCYFDLFADSATALNILPPPLSITGLSPVNAKCADSCNGELTVSVAGGTPPYFYIWSHIDTSDSSIIWSYTDSSNSTTDTLCAGFYTVEVIDSVGCSVIDTGQVTEPDTLVAVIDTFINATCSTPCNGIAVVGVTGGTPTYIYAWAGGGNSDSVSTLCAGGDTVTVTDANGCVDTTTVFITAAQRITVAIAVIDSASCKDTCDGKLTAAITGGFPPYDYLWDDPDSQTTLVADSLCAGIYVLTVTDTLGCSNDTTGSVTEPNVLLSMLVSSTYPSGHNISCYGLSDGDITQTVSGGTAPYLYTWDDGPNTKDRSGLPADTFRIVVTDTNGCVDTASIVLIQPDPLSASLSTDTFVSGVNIPCAGDSNGTIDLTVSGNTPPYQYSWVDGATTEDRSGLTEGFYSVLVTDTNGCTATSGITLIEPDSLTTTMSVTDATCTGGSDGSVTVSVTGGTPPYMYAWNTSLLDTATLINISAGTYVATVTDSNGCSTIDTAIVSQPPLILAELSDPNTGTLEACTVEDLVFKFSLPACDSIKNLQIQPLLPSGLSYVSGTISSNAGTITELDLSIPNQPIFSIPAIGAGQLVILDYQAFVSCNIIPLLDSGVLIIDSAKVVFDIGFVTDSVIVHNTQSYNVLYPNLVITSIDSQTVEANVGDEFTRTIRVKNGGNMPAVQFMLIDLHDTLNGIEVVSSNVGTLINGFGGDSILVSGINLLPGDSIDITETIKVTGCSGLNSDLSIGIICDDGSFCGSYAEFASVTIVPGAPSISAEISSVQGANYCGVDGVVGFTFTNTGKEAGPLAGIAKNLKAVIGYVPNVSELDNFVLNGNLIPDSIITEDTVEGFFVIDFAKLKNANFDGPGGLEDYNNDSIFADLAVGDSIFITADIHIDCAPGFNPEYPDHLPTYIAAGASFTDQCGKVKKGKQKEYFDADRPACTPLTSDNVPTDFVDGVPKPITICINKAVLKDTIPLSCPSDQYVMVLDLPPGYSIVSNVTWQGDSISHTMYAQDSIVLEDGARQGCYRFGLTLNNCSGIGPTDYEIEDTIRYEMLYRCDTGCSCVKHIIRSEIPVTSHYTTCGGPFNCLATTAIDVKRISFGWTDELKGTKVNADTSGISLNAAYVFDTIQVVARGVELGAFNNAHVEISYKMPDSINILSYTGAEAVVIIGGIPILCTPTAPTTSGIGAGPTMWRMEFNLTSCLPAPPQLNQNDTIILTANFVVINPTYLDTIDQSINTMIRAKHYAIVGSDSSGCASRRQSFVFHYPEHHFQAGGFNKCGIDLFNLNWRGDNLTCDRFPNEFRNMVKPASRIKAFIPAGYSFVDSIGASFVTMGNADGAGKVLDTLQYDEIGAATAVIGNDTIPGDTVVFIDPAWPLADEASRFFLNIPVKSDTTCPSDSLPFILYFDYNQYDYAPASGEAVRDTFVLELPFATPVPENLTELLQINALPHNKTIASDSVSFELLICDTISSLAGNDSIWVALDDLSGAFVFDTIIDLDSVSADTITLVDYNGFKYFLLDSLASIACKRFLITGAYSSCNEGAIRIDAGIRCPDFAADIGRAHCLPPVELFIMKPEKAIMQTKVEALVSGGISDCTPSAYEIEIINSGVKKITDIVIETEVPDGFVIDTAMLEHPGRSPLRGMPAPAFLGGNSYAWQIDTIDSLTGADGLTGINKEFEGSRLRVRIYFDIDTTVDFEQDPPLIRFNISGVPECNDTALFIFQADPTLEQPVNAAFTYVPADVQAPDTVYFTSVDSSGSHLWLVIGQTDTLFQDTSANPFFEFGISDSGTFTIVHVISKTCGTFIASDTVVLENFKVFKLITPPVPEEPCFFGCTSVGANLTTDPEFATDYNCSTSPPAFFTTNLTWACEPADFVIGRFAITNDASPWFNGLQGTDRTPAGNTNFFLGCVGPESFGGAWMEQSVSAGESYNASIWVRNTFEADCPSGGTDCLPSFVLYVYNQSGTLNKPLNFRNHVTHGDGWIQLCGIYTAEQDAQVFVGVQAVNGEFVVTEDNFSIIAGSDTAHFGLDDFFVFESAVPDLNIVASDTLACIDYLPSPVTLVASVTDTGVFTYLWSTGDTADSITVTPFSASVYSVTVTDSTACSAADSISIEVQSIPIASITLDGPTVICRLPGNTFQDRTLTASGGTAYLWSTGETAQSIVVNQAGAYHVTVSNLGCTDTASVTITQANQPPPRAKAGDDATINCGQSVLLGKPGPTHFLSFQWTPPTDLSQPPSPGGPGGPGIVYPANLRRPLASPTVTTTYTLTVTSAQTGCASSDDVLITVNGSCKTGSSESDSTGKETATMIKPVEGDPGQATITVYPNPFNERTVIAAYVPGYFGNKNEVVVVDLIGNEIMRYALKPGRNFIEIEPGQLGMGVYFYSLIVNGAIRETGKMVNIK